MSNKLTNKSKKTNILINVNIKDFLLTPLSCYSLISEILKGLLYQKNQIPYPFPWMKSIIEKKRRPTADDSEPNKSKPKNFLAANHYRLVSSTYDSIESILTSLENEFKHDGCAIEEIVVFFGTTPQCPSEAFAINISSLKGGHVERNHIADALKNQQKYLRNIFLSQDWMDSIDGGMGCTNTFVFIRKKLKSPANAPVPFDSCFLQSKPLNISDNLKKITVNLNCKTDNDDVPLCCNNLVIFNDKVGTNFDSAPNDVKINNCNVFEDQWYQSSFLIKGFKECYVNKKSVTEQW